jgi:hypothetical protein
MADADLGVKRGNAEGIKRPGAAGVVRRRDKAESPALEAVLAAPGRAARG